MIIDNNFGNLCMKKGGSFQKERFSFFSVVNGGVLTTPKPPRAYATAGSSLTCSLICRMKSNSNYFENLFCFMDF